MRYAVINPDKIVINVIIWDEVSNWEPPKDCLLIKSSVASIGDMYDNKSKSFVKPAQPKE